MTRGVKIFCGLSLLFLGLLVLSNRKPLLLFLALIPIGTILFVLYLFALSKVGRKVGTGEVAAADSVIAATEAIIGGYRKNLVKVTAIWICSGVVFSYSSFVLKLGLGADWLPILRTQIIRKGDPLYGYAMMDGIFLIAGLLFLSGLVWLPMYYFFEGLDAKSKISALRKKTNANA